MANRKAASRPRPNPRPPCPLGIFRPALEYIRRLGLLGLFTTVALPLLAQQNDYYSFKPSGHEANQKLAAQAWQANLARHANDSNILVLPGLVADKKARHIEVLVESAGLSPNAPCEFTIVGEQSEHAYESLLVSFAQPGAVYQALRFIGATPGLAVDPEELRFWAAGDIFDLSLVNTGAPPVRLEQLLLNRRTGRTLPEAGFRFTGSKWLPDPAHPSGKRLAADLAQPMALVSLFNSPWSVLEVPYAAAQGDVYQNTGVNPEHQFAAGTLLTLLIEPAGPAEAKPAKVLALQITAHPAAETNLPAGLERLKYLDFQLRDGSAVLNEPPALSSLLQTLGALDRTRNEYHLTVNFAGNVSLGSAQALAPILAIMDCDRGVRIDPPPPGQLYYRAFTPDRDLLERTTRLYHPWELSLAETNGVVSGRLVHVTPVYRNGSTKPQWQITEAPVATPGDVAAALAADAGPPTIMVFAPATLPYGQLLRLLQPALPSHRTVFVYLDEPMPPLPVKKGG